MNAMESQVDTDEVEFPEPIKAPPVTLPPVQPQPLFVSEEDRLRAENINLRLMNATQRETLVQHELNTAVNDRIECSKAVTAYREALGAKYGIDFDQFIIRSEDGMVIPRSR